MGTNMHYNILQNAIVYRNVITDPSSFIEEQLRKPLQQSGLSRTGQDVYDLQFRNSYQVTVSPGNPVVEKIREVAKTSNEKHFKINISKYSSETHFVQYNSGGVFEKHSDTLWPADVIGLNRRPIRKLTAIALLNEDFTGGKLALWYTNERYSFKFNAGDVLVFPSYVNHKVDPIENGTRYSLVSWSYGAF